MLGVNNLFSAFVKKRNWLENNRLINGIYNAIILFSSSNIGIYCSFLSHVINLSLKLMPFHPLEWRSSLHDFCVSKTKGTFHFRLKELHSFPRVILLFVKALVELPLGYPKLKNAPIHFFNAIYHSMIRVETCLSSSFKSEKSLSVNIFTGGNDVNLK